MALLCSNIALSERKTNFHWSSKIQNVTVCGPNYPLKVKDLFFAVNNYMKILSAWELFTDRSFRGKKLKICDFTSCTFPLSPLKVH